MTIRSAIASLLEGMATTLRADDAARMPPVAANDTVLKVRGPRRQDECKGFQHPVGFWLCTASTFDDFLVGHAYPALRHHSSVRIYPYNGSTWSPYWLFHEGRFCYPEHQLDFTYLGSGSAHGHPVDARSHEQRIQERFARRDAA